MLPEGWRDRLVLVTGENTCFVREWRLETPARTAADVDFTEALVRHKLKTALRA